MISANYICFHSELRTLQLGSSTREKTHVIKAEKSNGDTAFHLAAHLDAIRVAEVLLSHGANPGLKNANAETPAHAAARAGNLSMLKFLVEKGREEVFCPKILGL